MMMRIMMKMMMINNMIEVSIRPIFVIMMAFVTAANKNENHVHE